MIKMYEKIREDITENIWVIEYEKLRDKGLSVQTARNKMNEKYNIIEEYPINEFDDLILRNDKNSRYHDLI